MRTAELIDLMMNLVIYPCVVVLDTKVALCFINIVIAKAINDLKEAFMQT